MARPHHIGGKEAGFAPLSLSLATIIGVACIFAMSTHMFVPTLPQIRQSLSASPSWAQLTVTLNLTAYAVGTLLFGPLSDRFGRKQVLSLSVFGFVAVSIVCVLAFSIEILVAARIGQGFFGSAGTVLAIVMIRESVDDSRAPRWMSGQMIAVTVGVTFAPVLGAGIAEIVSWRGIFGALALMGFGIGIVLSRYVPETNVPQPGTLAPHRILKRYARVIVSRGFMAYQLMTAFGFAGTFAFTTAGPFVFIVTLGLSQLQYAMIHGGTALALIAGALANVLLSGRVTIHRIIVFALLIGMVACAIFVGTMILSGRSLAGICLALFLGSFSVGLFSANARVLMFDAVALEDRGAASAFAGFTTMALGAIASLAVVMLPAGSILALGLVLGGSIIASVVAYVVARRSRKRADSPASVARTSL